jgi:putative membrane protein
MNYKRALQAGMAAVLVALPALSQTPTSVREERVVSFIHQTNLFEIQAAKLALANSSSDAVKSFAQQMITDHQAADAQVRNYGTAHNIDIDALSKELDQVSADRLELQRRDRALGSATGEWAWTWENTLDKKNKDASEMAKLTNLRGAAFDREYVRAMVDGHQKAIDRLTNAKENRRLARETPGQPISSDLKDLIDGLLPTIQHHLEMAQALQAKVAKA